MLCSLKCKKNNKYESTYVKRLIYRDGIPSAASLTVEAAFVLPIFMFAMLLIAYIGLLVKTQDEVRHAMVRTVEEASAEVGAGVSAQAKSMVYYRGKLLAYLGDTSLTTSLVGSSFLEENDEIDLVVSYRTSLPLNIFGIWSPQFRERVHTRAFVGVDTRENAEEEDVVVYITENGRVYHRNKNCTYLKLSVSKVKYGDVDGMRNSSGGKYHPCHKCARGHTPHADADVYITNYGDRFHTNRACSEIKRTIKEIMLSEVGSRAPCSKCGFEGG